MNNRIPSIPLFQRLDGIYFNSNQNYHSLNNPIRQTYNQADGVIFQTQFNKDLIFNYFGEHENYSIIRNGADIDYISNIRPARSSILENSDKIWCCASSWRPHKRLSENIRFFKENAGPRDTLFVAGEVPRAEMDRSHRIHYLGNVSIETLVSFYKASDYFIHLAWLDHCPNVVVDARASGCKIICSSTGGTSEVAGEDAIIISEEPWDFSPVELYNPPPMDFSKTKKNYMNSILDMKQVSREYYRFFERGLL